MKLKTRTRRIRNIMLMIMFILYVGFIFLCVYNGETGTTFLMMCTCFGIAFIIVFITLEILCFIEPKFYQEYLIYKGIKVLYKDIIGYTAETERMATLDDVENGNKKGSHYMTQYYFIAYNEAKKIMIPITLLNKEIDKLNELDEDIKRRLKREFRWIK